MWFRENVVYLHYNNKGEKDMRTHTKKFAFGSFTYVQVKFDLFRVYDRRGIYCGLSNGVGEKIFC